MRFSETNKRIVVLLTLPVLLLASSVLLVLALTRETEQADERSGLVNVASGQVRGDTASGATRDPAADGGASIDAGTSTAADADGEYALPPLPEVEGVVSIDAVGDIVLGTETYGFAPGGGNALFAEIDSMFTGDIVLGNLEGTLAVGGESKCDVDAQDCFAFRSPPSEARWLRRSGFTTLNLANNHAYDFGAGALEETRSALDERRLDHVGAPGQIRVRRIGEIRVAVLGFSTYAWGADMRDIDAAVRLVRDATRLAHIVVVTMHAGAEGSDHQHVEPGTEYFLGESRGDPVRFARAAVDAGADLVVGHGPHVLRGMEWYEGRLIAYSMGNFAGYNVFNLTGPQKYSGVLKVMLNADGTWVRGELAATELVGKGVPAPDERRKAHALVRRLSSEDFGLGAVRINARGKLLKPRS